MSFALRLLDLDDPQRAERELVRVGADLAGVAKMKDKAAFVALAARAVKCAGANILKQEMLSIGGEVAVSRGVVNCSVERSDVLILGTRKQVRTLARKLRPQPFGLRRLGAEIEEVLKAHRCRFQLPWSGGSLDLSARPHVMGVLNVTPDSFSDGGEFATTEAAVERALRMVDEGADIVDIGGESTRPGSEPVAAEAEAARVLPVIERLASRLPVPISVDTSKAAVARRALAAGASLLNDVTGLRGDPEMAAVAAAAGAPIVVMHMRGRPRDMQTDTRYEDLVGEVYEFLATAVETAVAAGLPRDRVIVDPGIGFGKSAQGSLLLLQRLAEFRSLRCPVLVGASRKSFIGKVLGAEDPADRLEGSLAAATIAAWNGAHILRVHDVGPTRRALELTRAVVRAEEE